MTSHYTKVAFLSTNPVSDLVNPDCFNVYVSWNENLEKYRAITRRGRITFSKQPRWRAFRRAPLAFFSLLEELVHDPCETVRDKKDDFLMFMVLEKHQNNCQNAEIRTDAFVQRTVPGMSDSSFRQHFTRRSRPTVQMERKSKTSFGYQFERST